jgi:hypothetical protein
MPQGGTLHRIPIAVAQPSRRHVCMREMVMSDVAFIVLGLFWFALCFGYAAGCARL